MNCDKPSREEIEEKIKGDLSYETDYFMNLESKRYKECGYGNPYYDVNGHYDEVACCFNKKKIEWCGDMECPLDRGEPLEREDR